MKHPSSVTNDEFSMAIIVRNLMFTPVAIRVPPTWPGTSQMAIRKVKTETQHVWHLSTRVYYLVSLIIKVHVRPRRHELEKGSVQTPLRSKWPSRQAKPIYRQSDSQKAHMIPSFPSLWKPSQVQRPSKLAVPQQTLK